MGSFKDATLRTNCSTDLGTTSHESNYIGTSMPPKPKVPFRAEINHQLGSPPPKPSAPKPKTAIRRFTLKDVAKSLASNSDSLDQKLRTMSFKRRRVEIRLDLLHEEEGSTRQCERKIKRRHTEFYTNHQRPEIVTKYNGIPTDDSDSEDERVDIKRARLSSDNILSASCSNTQLHKFRRGTVTRRASHRITRLSPTIDRGSPIFHKPSMVPESAEISYIQTDESALIKRPSQKVRRARSVRLKRFLQKRFKMMLP